MLASPVSPSISLGSHTHSSHSSHNSRSSSIGGTSSPNGTYASPKHPAYLPSSSNNNNDNNARSPSQHSITSSSTGGANGNNSTSNYSKYTTHSQIERVNDVLVDKVLHAPIPLSFNQQRQPYYSQDNEEQGSALRRLTAFLDGEEDNVALSNAPIAGSSSREQPTMQHNYDASGSIYTSQQQSTHPSTPPSRNRTYSPHQHRNRDQTNYTPRQSSSGSNSNSRLHPSYGRASRQAPFEMHNRPQQRVHYDTQYPHHQEQHQQERKSRVTSPSAAEAKPSATGVYKQGNVQTGPSQSVLLSTQAQLERLKNEVTQLDELVNRLKAQHVTLDQAEALNMNIGSTADVGEERQGQDGYDHYNNHNAHESSNKTNAGSRQAEESDTRNNERTKKEKILEFENSIASQNDILNLIRYLDSLIWMRSSASSPSFKLYNQDEDGNINKREESRRRNSRINGKGIRNDNVIFARGNLDHLAKRITAWENIVRSKEEEVKYDFITR